MEQALTKRAGRGAGLRTAAALCFAALLVAFPADAKEGLRGGLELCYNVLVPSLFPFLFAADYLWSLLRPALRKSRGLCVFLCVVFSLCGGFPMGAKALAQARDLGALDDEQASLLLCGCVNAGPAYLLSGVGAGLFGSVRAGLLLLIPLTLASLLTLGLVRAGRARAFRRSAAPRAVPRTAPASLSLSLSGAVRATVGLCAYVLLFSCASALFFRLLALARVNNVFLCWLFTALCEVSSGCAAAGRVGSTAGLYLALASVSLCGASVLLQVRALAEPQGIRLLPLLLSRPLHLLLSTLLLRGLLAASGGAPVFAPAGPAAARLCVVSPELSFFLFLLALIVVGGRKTLSMFTI